MQKPLVSFVLLAYNQEEYVREAVEGAFAQTYRPLEIILSDDCSNDKTFEIMRELASTYHGPHVVRLNRNAPNLGIVKHVNRVFGMASGELVVTGAGDDVSLPTRVEDAVELWLRAGRRPDGFVFGWMDYETGIPWWHRAQDMTVEAFIDRGLAPFRGAAAAWSMRLFGFWGPLPEDALAEDQVLAFRALLQGGVLLDDRAAVRYRGNHGRGKAPGHRLLAGKLWNLKRTLQFYKVYESDLRWLMTREPHRGARLGELLSQLQGRVQALKAEIDYLEKSSRISGLVYAVALLMGRTWTRGPFRMRMGRALTVLRRLTFEGRRIGLLDENDHHGNRVMEDK